MASRTLGAGTDDGQYSTFPIQTVGHALSGDRPTWSAPQHLGARSSTWAREGHIHRRTRGSKPSGRARATKSPATRWSAPYFGAGERTEPITPDEVSEEALHGDFAEGERTKPIAPDEETPRHLRRHQHVRSGVAQEVLGTGAHDRLAGPDHDLARNEAPQRDEGPQPQRHAREGRSEDRRQRAAAGCRDACTGNRARRGDGEEDRRISHDHDPDAVPAVPMGCRRHRPARGPSGHSGCRELPRVTCT